MMKRNPILATDYYKACHPEMYPAGYTGAFGYLEARGGFSETVFFGLQAFVKDYLLTPITMADVDEAEEYFKDSNHPFPREGWERIVNVHKGYLPIIIRAVPEGTVVPVGNALVTVQSTDPEIPWIAGWVETMLLRAIWYPTTVCTNSWNVKRNLYPLMSATCDAPDKEIVGKVSEFGARGVSSGESAALGACAHLVNFLRTATVEGVRLARQYYNCKNAGSAIPSAEHSVILSWGKDREADCYSHILSKFAKPGAVVSVVSDTYDYEKTVTETWCGTLVDQVKASGGVIAIRPDSGDMLSLVPWTLAKLDAAYGSKVNSKGFKVLNNVRVIWGDGLKKDTLIALAHRVVAEGYSLTNVFFGMGGGMLQQVHRDEGKFAYKLSAAFVDGKWVPVKKFAPGKESKAGRLALVRVRGQFQTVAEGSWDYGNRENLLRRVYDNGCLIVDDSLDEIRDRAADGLVDSLRDAA